MWIYRVVTSSWAVLQPVNRKDVEMWWAAYNEEVVVRNGTDTKCGSKNEKAEKKSRNIARNRQKSELLCQKWACKPGKWHCNRDKKWKGGQNGVPLESDRWPTIKGSRLLKWTRIRHEKEVWISAIYEERLNIAETGHQGSCRMRLKLDSRKE